MSHNASPGLDRLIGKVVDDANRRGAGIAGFKVLPNGKAVLYPREYPDKLPQYFGTRFCMIDTLVHRYNLKRRYRFLYNRRSAAAKRQTAAASAAKSNKTVSLEEQARIACDGVLRHAAGYELQGKDRHRIYTVMQKLDSGKGTMAYTTFGRIKEALISHYYRRMSNTAHVVDRVKLKQIVEFFIDMEYHDLF